MNEILSLLKTFAQEESTVTTDNTTVCESCGGNMNEQPSVISLSDILRLAGIDSMPSAQQPTEVPASADACTCPHCGSAHSPVSEEQDAVDEAKVKEDDMEEGKQDRIQKARDLLDRACGLDACSPEELGDHRIDMIAQETGLKRGHVKSIANHMDDEDDMEEGNAFTGAKAEAEAEGKAEFEVSGEKYKVEADDGMGSAFMKAYETLLRNKQ